MSLVHTDSASTSGSSGLCRCLVWDNACGNIYFGLLISVTADAYRFDSRKLIKGPALPACLVVQYLVFFHLRISVSSERSPLHWVHHSQGMMNAFSSAFWYRQARRGIGPCQAGKLWIWCTEVRFTYSPWHSHSSDCWPGIWLVFHENETSVLTVICLGLGSSRSVALSALDVDNYHFCGPRDFPGEPFQFSRFKVLRHTFLSFALTQSKEKGSKHRFDFYLFSFLSWLPCAQRNFSSRACCVVTCSCTILFLLPDFSTDWRLRWQRTPSLQLG